MPSLSNRRRFRHAALAAVLVLLGGAAGAQEPAAGGERIGLVLSGGGARGCAHVGVLKVLEELRVPVHCITGTSLGSIVGGFYAYGLSPDRLEQEMTRSGNRRPWGLLLQDQPLRSQRTFRRKQEDYEFLVDIGLGFRDGEFRLPKGLVQGQNLELELLGLSTGAHALGSFDELPIPFRAVAVELRTGKRVVLERGNLAMAMRASMSLPGILAPAVLDGVELLDGGLVDNVPIALAREMGATRLIVVDIGTPVEIDEVNSALAVSSQMVQIMGQQNVDDSLALLQPSDVFIQPDLGDITSADFGRAAESIEIGEAAARAAADRLRELALGETEYATYLAAQRRQVAPVTIHEVQIDNRSGLGDALIRARVEVEPGHVLDVEE
jgi:NTE family protein